MTCCHYQVIWTKLARIRYLITYCVSQKKQAPNYQQIWCDIRIYFRQSFLIYIPNCQIVYSSLLKDRKHSNKIIDSNFLKEIQPGIFKELKNLSELYLESNTLEEIRTGVFSGLGNLTSLSLYSNMLKVIEPVVLSGMGRLQQLSVKDFQSLV